MIVFGRTLSFLRDSGFQKSLEGRELTKREKGIIWRTYTIDYFLEKCLGLPGDVLEVGCYQGTTAKIMTERHDFSEVSKLITFLISLETSRKRSTTSLRNTRLTSSRRSKPGLQIIRK